MVTKTPSIRTCKMLKGEKRDSGSFFDEIDGLLEREKPRLVDYFGAIKDEDLLRGLEEDSRKIRESSLKKPRF